MQKHPNTVQRALVYCVFLFLTTFCTFRPIPQRDGPSGHAPPEISQSDGPEFVEPGPEPIVPSPASVQCRVVDKDGNEPLENVEVTYRIKGGNITSGATDSQGVFRATIEPGQVELTVQKEKYETRKKTFIVKAGGLTKTFVTLEQKSPPVAPERLHVGCRVLDGEDSTPISGVRVTYRTNGNKSMSVKTNEQGRCEPKMIINPGTVQLTAIKKGYQLYFRKVTAENNLTISLKPKPATIACTVVDFVYENQPIIGAKVKYTSPDGKTEYVSGIIGPALPTFTGNVQPGRVIIHASKLNYITKKDPVLVRRGQKLHWKARLIDNTNKTVSYNKKLAVKKVSEAEKLGKPHHVLWQEVREIGLQPRGLQEVARLIKGTKDLKLKKDPIFIEYIRKLPPIKEIKPKGIKDQPIKGKDKPVKGTDKRIRIKNEKVQGKYEPIKRKDETKKKEDESTKNQDRIIKPSKPTGRPIPSNIGRRLRE